MGKNWQFEIPQISLNSIILYPWTEIVCKRWSEFTIVSVLRRDKNLDMIGTETERWIHNKKSINCCTLCISMFVDILFCAYFSWMIFFRDILMCACFYVCFISVDILSRVYILIGFYCGYIVCTNFVHAPIIYFNESSNSINSKLLMSWN